MAIRNRTQLATDISTYLPDNITGDISPSDVRTTLVNIVDSALLPQDSGSFHSSINITISDFYQAKDNGVLISGSVYKITDYDDNNGIFLTALSSGSISNIGSRLMWCPTQYTTGGSWKGVWHPKKIVSVNNLVIWGGYVWKNLTGVIGTATDNVTLDDTNWILIPKTSFTNGEYTEFSFGIVWDIDGQYIVRQWDGNGNIIGISGTEWSNLSLNAGSKPCDITDWNSGFIRDNVVASIFNNTGSSLSIKNNTNRGAIYNNITSTLTGNSNIGSISNNTGSSITNNSNLGSILNNTGSIQNNSNGGVISSNRNVLNGGGFIGTILNNSNDGAIQNNTNTGSIKFNTNNGNISDNTNTGSIQYNSNAGAISSNTNRGHISFNSCKGDINNQSSDISNNNNNGFIMNNSNLGSITNNVNSVTNISNNSNGGIITSANTGSIQYNSNNGDIDNNSNSGSINYNSNKGDIKTNFNKGNINYNSNEDRIFFNSNTGSINYNSNKGIIISNSNSGSINNNSNNGYIQTFTLANYPSCNILNNTYGNDLNGSSTYSSSVDINGNVPKTITSSIYTVQPWDWNNLYTYVSGATIIVPDGLTLPHNSIHTSISVGSLLFSGSAIYNTSGHTRSNGQYAQVSLVAISSNNYILGGNTAP